MRNRNFLSVFITLFVFVSLVTSANNNPEETKAKGTMPDNVKAIIDKSCFGCHNTDSRNEDAKEDLDFKKLETLSLMKKISAYKHIGEVVEKNEMPPKKFLEKKPESKLTELEKKTLMDWAKKEAEALVKNK